MSKTLTTGLNLLRAKLDTITGSGGDWGSELTDYLNEAQRDIIFDLPEACWNSAQLGTESTTPSVDPSGNLYLFAHASDWLKTVSLYITSGTSVYQPARLPSPDAVRNRAASSNYTTAGAGQFYCAYDGHNILFWPITTDYTIAERYVKVPTELTTSSSTFSVPDHYFEKVVDKALISALLQKGETDKAMAWKSIYDAFVVSEWRRFGLEPPPAFVHAPQPKG